MATEIVLIRHGATEWSVDGRHTGRTDLPLTPEGRAQAEHIAAQLTAWHFALVLTSPLTRARDTAALCGCADRAQVDEDLREWDYGQYEGRTTADIRTEHPGWSIWTGPCPGGETAADVGVRADRVIARASTVDGAVALFGHGHQLRVLIARWVELLPTEGARFALDTATISVLGFERETRVLRRFNA